MPNYDIFLPTKDNLDLFIDESLIPEGFEYGINNDVHVALIVAQVFKNRTDFDFMSKFKEVFNDMDANHLAIRYYIPQLYKKVLNISNEEWDVLVHSSTGLSTLGNVALSQVLHTTVFDDEVKSSLKYLSDTEDFYPSTGVINLDHLKESA